MIADARIRAARREDARGIVLTIREGFDPSLLPLFIYGCDGVERYVEAQIELRDRGSDTVFTVACGGESIVGCVELRRYPDELFLNYISILSIFRSRGLGKPLLEFAIETSRSAGQVRMSLDVLDRNVAARAWYEKLGFAHHHDTDWWDVPVSSTGKERFFLISGFPQASLCHEAFGFSLVRVTTASGSYEIGRLGKNWFRVFRVEALRDPGVAAALRRLDPSRNILAILNVEGNTSVPPAPGARRICRSLRLTSGLDELLAKLRRGR